MPRGSREEDRDAGGPHRGRYRAIEADTFTESYAIHLQSADAFDQETRAIRDIAERFAESLVTNLLEGF